MSTIVEIESSPEPGTGGRHDSNFEEVPPGPSSLTRRRGMMSTIVSAAAGPGPSTVASRARAGRHTVKNCSSIIELTDSESDDAGKPVSRGARSLNTPLTRSLSRTKTHASVARPPGISAIDGAADEGKKETLPRLMETREEAEKVVGGLGQTAQPPAPPAPARLQGSQGELNAAVNQPRDDAPIFGEDQAAVDANEHHAAPDVPTPQQEQQEGNLAEPESEEVIISSYMAQVLEIIPDVAPDYLLALIMQLYPQHRDGTIDLAIQMLFDDAQYPKVERKGKRTPAEDLDIRALKRARIEYFDYSQQDRLNIGGPDYTNMSIEHLQTSFPYVPKPFIRKVLFQHNNLYAPTHIYITDLYKQFNHSPKERPTWDADFPFSPRKTPFKPQPTTLKDAEFEKERQWVLVYDEEDGDLVRVRARLSAASGNDIDPKGKGKVTVDDQEDEDEDQCPEGEGIECNCCFTEYSIERMIQCPEGHLFCRSCVVTYAANQLGLHDIRLKCMDQSGCSLLYPETELRRVLSDKLIALYDRLKQQKEIEEADIEGLEECPFCDYKCVMEMDKAQEKLFRCYNYDGGCGAISCRECKRPDHLPRSCKEMDEDRVLDKQHVIEEAMSAALMRTCPKCQKPFIKDAGCNKITCYTCRTMSCYVCRKIIKGYDHFYQNDPFGSSGSSSSKCPLWDPVETRHAQEVKAAAEKAMDDLKTDNPDIDASAIKIDVPIVQPPPNPTPLQPPPVVLPPMPGVAPNLGYALGQALRPVWPGHNPAPAAAPFQVPHLPFPANPAPFAPLIPAVPIQQVNPFMQPLHPPVGLQGGANRNVNPPAQNQPRGRRRARARP